MTDARQFAPSAHRNRDAIRDALIPHWPAAGNVLEIASGSGEHVVHFASAAPHLRFHPTDPSEAARASTDAWVARSGLSNVLPAIELDVTAPIWPVGEAAMMICINMIHIAPWEATTGLMAGAGRSLAKGGALWLYGPFIRDGVETAEGNVNFDLWLKDKDARFGVRHLGDVADVGAANGLAPPTVIEMPANNCLVGFAKV